MTNSEPQRWAGERLGLPQTGAGSLARMPRRILAIAIDWGSSLLLSHAFFADDNGATLIIFGLLQLVGLAVVGSSVGMLCSGITVRKLVGGKPGFYAATIRTILLLLVIPVAIWDADSRGLHDKAAKTVMVRR